MKIKRSTPLYVLKDKKKKNEKGRRDVYDNRKSSFATIMKHR